MFAKIKRTFLSFVIVLTPFMAGTGALMPVAAHAADGDKCNTGITFFPSWYENLCDKSTGQIKSPGDASLGKDTSARLGMWITIIALNIVTMLLFVVGYVSLGFIIYGGFRYMISGDSSGGTVMARKTITNAVIGLLLSIMSVAIIKFVAGAITA